MGRQSSEAKGRDTVPGATDVSRGVLEWSPLAQIDTSRQQRPEGVPILARLGWSSALGISRIGVLLKARPTYRGVPSIDKTAFAEPMCTYMTNPHVHERQQSALQRDRAYRRHESPYAPLFAQ